jgi:uncharacterized membrane protein YagU involved in acid resistance
MCFYRHLGWLFPCACSSRTLFVAYLLLSTQFCLEHFSTSFMLKTFFEVLSPCFQKNYLYHLFLYQLSSIVFMFILFVPEYDHVSRCVCIRQPVTLLIGACYGKCCKANKWSNYELLSHTRDCVMVNMCAGPWCVWRHPAGSVWGRASFLAP